MTPRKAGVAKLIEVQSGLCAYCGAPFLDGKGKLSPTLDHVWPRSSGRTKVGNVLAVHYGCNKRKGKRRPNACELIMLSAINLKRTEGCSGAGPGQIASVDTHAKHRDVEQARPARVGSAVAATGGETPSTKSGAPDNG